MQNTIDQAVTITVTAQPNGTFDMLYAPDHEFDRLGVTLEQLRVEVASMVMEIRYRLSSRVKNPRLKTGGLQ